jgi:hypothetical protein
MTIINLLKLEEGQGLAEEATEDEEEMNEAVEQMNEVVERLKGDEDEVIEVIELVENAEKELEAAVEEVPTLLDTHQRRILSPTSQGPNPRTDKNSDLITSNSSQLVQILGALLLLNKRLLGELGPPPPNKTLLGGLMCPMLLKTLLGVLIHPMLPMTLLGASFLRTPNRK